MYNINNLNEDEFNIIITALTNYASKLYDASNKIKFEKDISKKLKNRAEIVCRLEEKIAKGKDNEKGK